MRKKILFLMWMVVGGFIAFMLASFLSRLILNAVGYCRGEPLDSVDPVIGIYVAIPLSWAFGILGTKLFYKSNA